ncbi:MAG: hypothetical protein ACFCU1_06850 [Sumerlaeia bacterium]
MPANKLLKNLFLKTLAVNAFVAVLVTLRVDLQWGGAFALASIVGLLNWISLSGILIGATSKQLSLVAFGLVGKFIAWTLIILLVLSPLVQNMTALLLGFTTFLIVALLEALGTIISGQLSKNSTGRPLPSHLLKGRPEDA